MILVTGATGTNGREIVQRLSALGAEVRAMARNPQRAGDLRLPRVEVVRGDYSDPASLRAAMRGVEKVFLLAPVHARQVELESNVIYAAGAASVKHLVKFSVILASPKAPSRLLRWHAETEENIRRSGIPFTFLRPNMFMQEIGRQAASIKTQGAFYLPLGDAKVSLVDVRDIAAVATAVLTEPGHEGKTYELTGPQALSFKDVAEKIAAAANRDVAYVPITMDQFRAALVKTGAPEWMADVVCELYALFPGRNNLIGDGVMAATGRPPRDFNTFARDFASQFKAA
jgi:uncharacterized protein YbjT (DUF2867 family)